MFASLLAVPAAGVVAADVDVRGGTAREVTEEDGRVFLVVDGDEATAPVRVTVEASSVEAGARHWVNLSDQPPRVLVPEGGLLTLDLPWAVNTHVLIEPAPEAALAEGFDGRGEGLPEGWGRDLDASGARAVAAEESAYRARPGLPLGGAEATSVKLAAGAGRGGSDAVRIHKPTAGGEAYATSVRVDVEPGVEHLAEAYYHVEQMAWGGMGYFAVELIDGDGGSRFVDYHRMNPLQDNRPGQWRRAFTRFTPREGETRARLWFGVTAAPITVAWDDARIIVAPTAIERGSNPLPDAAGPAQRTEAEVRAMLAAESAKPAEVRMVAGQPTLHVGGEPIGNFSFNPGYYDWESGQPQYHGVAGRQGVPIHTVPIALGDSLGSGDALEDAVWQGPDDFDFSIIEDRILETLRRAPDALIRLNLSPEPYYGFHLDHPDALFRTAEGQVVTGYTHSAPLRDLDEVGDTEFVSPSYASATFRELSGDAFERVGRYLAENDIGKRVIGIHLIGGHDGQWLPHANKHGEHGMRDFGPEHLAAFRAWLRGEHGDDAELQKAWDDDDVTLKDAMPADDAAFTADHVFLDPSVGSDRRMMDTARFIQVGKVDTIEHLLEAFDRGLGRPAYNSVYWSDVYHGHDLDHWATAELLEVDALDAIASIGDYNNWRRQGRPGAMSSAAASLRLHGKAYIAEVDHRTPHAWGNSDANDNQDWLGQIVDPLDPVHAARREWGQAFALGAGGWHYGLGGQGFGHAPYVDAFGEAAGLAQHLAENPRLDTDRPAVAAFADERAVTVMSQKDIINLMTTQLSGNMARDPLSTSGLGYDPYLLTDLDHPDRPAYAGDDPALGGDDDARAGGLGGAEPAAGRPRRRRDERRRADSRRRRRRHRPSPDRHRRGDGRGHQRHQPPEEGRRRPAEPADRLPPPRHAGPADPRGRRERGAAGPARRPRGRRRRREAARRLDRRVHRRPRALTPELLRNLAAEAGVEPIGPAGDLVMAGNGVVVVHGMTLEPEKKLRLGGPATLVDATTGERIAADGEAGAVTVEVPFGETRWFRREAPAAGR